MEQELVLLLVLRPVHTECLHEDMLCNYMNECMNVSDIVILIRVIGQTFISWV